MSLQILFKHISQFVDQISRWILSVLMAVMVADVLMGVFNRFLFKMSISWTEELARFLIVWISMLGTAVALKKGVHVSITALVNRLGSMKAPVLYFNAVILGLFLIFISIYGIRLCISQFGQLSPALRLSMFWPLLAIPAGSIIMLLHLLAALMSHSELLKINGFQPISGSGKKE